MSENKGMKVFKVTISPELRLLANALGIELEFLIYNGILDRLDGVFRSGDEISRHDIERWIKIEEET